MEIYKKGDIFECQFTYSGENWEKTILLMSDEHYDSPHCDRALLKKHHEKAKALDAPIFKFGDVFDCMGGKYDPRTHKGDIRPEHNVKDYFDAVTKDAHDFYKDYDVAFISPGNHEENVLHRHETDLIGNLGERLDCAVGDYSGWLRFSFYNQTGGGKRHLDMYYNHEGGAGPVSLGVIKTNRNAVNYNADIYVNGHNHNRWQVERVNEKINAAGNIKRKEQLHINSGTYNTKPAKGRERYDSKYGQPNLGGVFLTFAKRGKDEEIYARAMFA